ncbi:MULTISPECIES: type 2 isopentenyl-diphosphate Delta-isomerase [Bacillaceae]|uniref:type 2 isopentenyl-diphosphate Delta-isomerase n=1 Tax=Bacillaceae TaxID=186817 RepID=UPI002FFEAB97
MNLSRSERKWDHIRFALETGQQPSSAFDDIKFVHQSLPNISVFDVRLDQSIGELYLSSPIFINAMTGGGGEKTYQINKDLAKTAKETGLAMAVGSQMAAVKNKNERYTFEIVRKENPNGIILANIGSEATGEEARTVIEMVQANALQIHLNVIQELAMPEGDRDFKGALNRIETIVNSVNVPVIVKEVGFGMSKETAAALSSVGVSIVDVGGFGGTNFAEIENKRRNKALSYFAKWGITTPVSIVEAMAGGPLFVIASGGIKGAEDIVKSIALGADAVGMAGYLLRILVEKGLEHLIAEIENLQQEVKMIMTALGAKRMADLKRVPLVITGETYQWLTQRGIETSSYSRRSI